MIKARQNERCANRKCRVPLVKGNHHFDHGHARGLGGSEALKNFRALCIPCHKVKTFGTGATTKGSDIHAIYAVKRIRKGGRKRRGRPMAGTVASGWKKPMHGKGFRRSKR